MCYTHFVEMSIILLIVNFFIGDYSDFTVTIEVKTSHKLGTIQISCITTGPPVYLTHWHKGTDLIHPSCKHSITSSHPGINILTIHDATVDDAGPYTCTASSYYTTRSVTAATIVTLQG